MTVNEKEMVGINDGTQHVAEKHTVGLVNNPCGAAVCAKNSIDPEEFLSECFAPVCWDCWFVSQKIQL
jgi:hypothetical protein